VQITALFDDSTERQEKQETGKERPLPDDRGREERPMGIE
jgi:hypothetical protein